MYIGLFIIFINECIPRYSKFSRRLLPKTPHTALGMQITNLWVTECLRVGHLYFYKIIWAVHCICKGQYSEQVINTNTSMGTGYALRYPRGYDICRASCRWNCFEGNVTTDDICFAKYTEQVVTTSVSLKLTSLPWRCTWGFLGAA